MPENYENSNHNIIIEGRRKATMTGILDVGSFDDEAITAESDCGEINIQGRNLKISRLSVESGDMTVEGEIDVISYREAKSGGSLLSRVFR